MGGPDNDRWWADFVVQEIGRHEYTVEAWVDRLRDVDPRPAEAHRRRPGRTVDLRIGADLVDAAATRADTAGAADDATRLRAWAAALRRRPMPTARRRVLPRTRPRVDGRRAASRPQLRNAIRAGPRGRRRSAARALLRLVRAVPALGVARSAAATARSRDVIARLDVRRRHGLRRALPAADPSRSAGRSARARTTRAARRRDDPGSPWAIGAAEGGHTAVHPELGTLDGLSPRWSTAAASRGIEVALDIAFQASPDHPWVTRAPDVVPQPPRRHDPVRREPAEEVPGHLSRSTSRPTRLARALWRSSATSFVFWIDQGVRIFRVDNPHTKPFPFWEWCIGAIKARPSRGAVPGRGVHAAQGDVPPGQARASASRTRTSRGATRSGSSTEYLTELTTTDVREFFRPNFWPNTPDILHADLQDGGRPDVPGAARARGDAVGATTASTGRPFELVEQHAARAGQRGIPRLREVPAADLGSRATRTACATLIATRQSDARRAIRRSSERRHCGSTRSTTSS